jgi:hypothetical protein
MDGPAGSPDKAAKKAGKEIQAPVKESTASGKAIQKPLWWWRLSLVVERRLHLRPRVKRPLSGHHSQSPVRAESSIATPIQPTTCRPTPGTIREPWRT